MIRTSYYCCHIHWILLLFTDLYKYLTYSFHPVYFFILKKTLNSWTMTDCHIADTYKEYSSNSSTQTIKTASWSRRMASGLSPGETGSKSEDFEAPACQPTRSPLFSTPWYCAQTHPCSTSFPWPAVSQKWSRICWPGPTRQSGCYWAQWAPYKHKYCQLLRHFRGCRSSPGP